MAKKKNNPTKETSKNLSKNAEMEKSDEVLSEAKPVKKVEKASKDDKKNKKLAKKSKPRRNYIKEVFSELKKVSWPTFGQACARTGVVLGVVAIFMVVVLGIDLLLTWLVSLVV